MSDDGFERLGDSDERMYGPRAIIATGFDIGEQERLLGVLSSAALEDVPVRFATDDDMAEPLGELASCKGTTGQGHEFSQERAVVLSGVTETELHRVMGSYRAAGLPRPLWATMTETSTDWSLRELLTELAAERAALGG